MLSTFPPWFIEVGPAFMIIVITPLRCSKILPVILPGILSRNFSQRFFQGFLKKKTKRRKKKKKEKWNPKEVWSYFQKLKNKEGATVVLAASLKDLSKFPAGFLRDSSVLNPGSDVVIANPDKRKMWLTLVAGIPERRGRWIDGSPSIMRIINIYPSFLLRFAFINPFSLSLSFYFSSLSPSPSSCLSSSCFSPSSFFLSVFNNNSGSNCFTPVTVWHTHTLTHARKRERKRERKEGATGISATLSSSQSQGEEKKHLSRIGQNSTPGTGKNYRQLFNKQWKIHTHPPTLPFFLQTTPRSIDSHPLTARQTDR